MSKRIEGRLAYKEGIYQDDNPYEIDSKEHKEWMSGWFDAEEESGDDGGYADDQEDEDEQD